MKTTLKMGKRKEERKRIKTRHDKSGKRRKYKH